MQAHDARLAQPCHACTVIRLTAGAMIVATMTMILLGIWLAPSFLLAHVPRFFGLGINTAIALALAGLALIFPRMRGWLGGFLAVASAAVIVQFLFAWLPPDGFWRIVLNVDGRGLSWPGRMAPLSAFSLLCAGLALSVLDRAPRLPVQILLQLVPGLILTAAVGGILNRYLDGLLFVATLDRYAIMSPPTMTALSILVAGYLAALLETPWFRRFYQRREDRQVLAIGLAGFFAAMLLGGAASIAVLGRQMQETVADDLSRAVQVQAAAFPLVVSSSLQNLHARVEGELSRDDLPALLRKLAGPEGAAWLEQRDGAITLSTGRPRVVSQFRLRLRNARPAWLIREQEWRLEMHFPAARARGTIVVQEPLRMLDSFFSSSPADAAKGVETRLCERSGQHSMACFPSLFMPRPVLMPQFRNDQYVPMWRALEGQSGVTVASDYRGVLVVAAYTPLAELGLGMVRKIDAEKMYQPIRTSVWRAIGVMVGIGMLAVLLIYLRVRRVVRQSMETGRQLRGVLDVLPVGVWFADAEGRLVMNNPVASRIWQGERWIGVNELSVYKGWWHDSGKRIEAHEWALARALRQGEVSVDEIIDIECFDGSRKIISNSALPLYDDKGIFVGAVVVNKDITGPVMAEEELSASRDLLRSIVENAPVRVFWKDVELHYLGCNAAFARDAGMRSPEELIGKDDFQMGWREQAERYRADDRQVMDSDTPIIGYEEQQTTPDGRLIWLRTSKVPLHDANGKVIGVLGIYDDITAHKQMMEALRREKDKLDEAQHVAGMGSWELDLVENVLTWSDEMYRIFEVDPERFGASYEAFLDTLHPDDRERVNQVYTQSLKTREPYEVEHRLLFPDGRIKHVIERCETFCNVEGGLLRSVGTTQDITGG